MKTLLTLLTFLFYFSPEAVIGETLNQIPKISVNVDIQLAHFHKEKRRKRKRQKSRPTVQIVMLQLVFSRSKP